jgi:hypothetical protein
MLLIVAVAASRSHASPPTSAPVLRQFAWKIDEQFHACIPLGWFPEGLPGSGYVPGYNANANDKDALFQAIWVGVVPARTLNDPHAVAVKAVLDELTRLGLLVRHDLPGIFRYNLTHEGERYYYDRNHLGNNVEGWSYLCFSRLHAKDVAWSSRPTKGGEAYRNDVIARIRFTWEPTRDAPWATRFLKAHAVILNPTSSPAQAMALAYPNGRWALAELDFSFGLIADPSAWDTRG